MPASFSFRFAAVAVAASRFLTVAGSSSRSCADKHPKAARNLLKPVRLRLGLAVVVEVLLFGVGAARDVDGPAVGDVMEVAGAGLGVDLSPAGVVEEAIALVLASGGVGEEVDVVGRVVMKCAVSGVAGVNDIVGASCLADCDPDADVEGTVGSIGNEEARADVSFVVPDPVVLPVLVPVDGPAVPKPAAVGDVKGTTVDGGCVCIVGSVCIAAGSFVSVFISFALYRRGFIAVSVESSFLFSFPLLPLLLLYSSTGVRMRRPGDDGMMNARIE